MIKKLAGASFCDLDKGVLTFDFFSLKLFEIYARYLRAKTFLLVRTNQSHCAPIDTVGAVNV